MQLTDDTIYTRATRRLKVTGEGKPMILSGMYGNKPGRVETVTIEYIAEGDSPRWKVQSIHLVGTALKADGSDSKNTFHQSVYGWDLKADRYAWLREVIERARPTSAPLFTSSFEGREYAV